MIRKKLRESQIARATLQNGQIDFSQLMPPKERVDGRRILLEWVKNETANGEDYASTFVPTKLRVAGHKLVVAK